MREKDKQGEHTRAINSIDNTGYMLYLSIHFEYFGTQNTQYTIIKYKMSESLFIIGATGLVGSHFLNIAAGSTSVSKIVTLSRRTPKLSSNITNKDVLKPIVESKTDLWPEIIKTKLDIPDKSTIFSGFGTTRKAAGSAENFVKIDHDINVNAFKAAKESGKFDTAIIVSASGASKDSVFLYMSTKGKIEDELKALKFKRTIILRPGILLGKRDKAKDWKNTLSASIGGFFKGTFAQSLVGYPIYAEEVAKAAWYLNQQPIKKEGEVIEIGSKEMIDLVKTISEK